MAEAKFNLLEEGHFGVRRGGHQDVLSLPGVLSALSASEDIEFTALRPHQRHAWHAFLVQLAALFLARLGERELPTGEGPWHEGLLHLTDDFAEPWCLVVGDLDKPAFFQPPVPEGTLDALKNLEETPDGIDILVLARNHDVKMNRIVAPEPQHWAYALTSLQTMEGFSGRGNYGISRMNSGFGNRPCVTVAPELAWPVRFRRDVGLWLEARSRLVEQYNFDPEKGEGLLWLLPWEGESCLDLTRCDPFYIEICRRVRLVERDADLAVRIGNSKVQRIAAKDLKGDTGDIWTPLRRQDGAALTVAAEGFSFQKIHEVVLSGDYQPSLAQSIRPEDGKRPVLIVEALARGQGGTEGFHERAIPIPPKARSFLTSPDGREKLASLSERRTGQAARASRYVLKPAIRMLLQGGPEPSDLDNRDDRPRDWARALDARIDACYFEELWKAIDLEPEEANRSWDELLYQHCSELLEEAIDSAPIPEARRFRAVARAEWWCRAMAKKHLPGAFSEEGEDHAA